MFQSQIVRATRETIAAPDPAVVEARAERLRQLFTASEARTFGLDVRDEKEGANAATVRPLLRGLAAVVASVALFTSFGFLATLGMTEPGLAITAAPTTLA